MLDTPYTRDDLVSEAARQHAALTADPDFVGVGEQMDGTPIDSEDSSSTWDGALNEGEFDAAQREIHELIDSAADTSEWAVQLGVDGLDVAGHTLVMNGDDQPLMRLHFAFHPDMPPAARIGFIERIGQLMAEAL